MKPLSVNRRAEFDYEILEVLEAGIVLSGSEAKSVRDGRMNLAGGYAVIRGGEAWLIGAEIPPYQPKNSTPGYDPVRTRKLLLHRHEVESLVGSTAERGLTIVALRAYTKGPRVKIALGLARRRKKHDQRERIRKHDAEREMGRR